MSEEHWNETFAKSLGVFLSGHGVRAVSDKGEPVVDDSFYIMFNSYHDVVQFSLPGEKWGKKWLKVMDTFNAEFNGEGIGEPLNAGQQVDANGRSVMLFREISAS